MANEIATLEISLNTQDFLLSGFLLKARHTLNDVLDKHYS
jgi:hypothetical protein